tara:strand:- start:3869 stop:5626 length:1758 start_codon:yes stop_codon:yes gene_type:complete
MKLVYLGLLLIFSCIIIYEIVNYKEGFNFEDKNKEQKNWGDSQKDYWKAENSPNITETGEENTVLKLNKDKTKLVEIEPVEKNEKSDLALEIERCQTINKTGKCDNLVGSKCGYCWSSNKMMYGDVEGPYANVCQEGWIPPGPSASKNCTKIKEQRLCAEMTDCGDSTGEKSICGWCPATAKGIMAKEDGSMVPKYEDDKCEWNNTSDIKGVLIKPNDCKKFGQLFPCVGTNMLTGPHSDECLQSEWAKSKCTGKVQDRITDPQFFSSWNSNAYSHIGDNIKTAIKDVADSGKNYNEVKKRYKQCYDQDVNPCENRFDPKPLDCLRKKYSESGCSEDGILNPKTLTQPQAEHYLNDSWMKNQTSVWSANEYATNIGTIFTKANQGKTFPKGPVGTGPIDSGRAFDDALKNNLLCHGNKLEIPFEKPCWKDFISIMLSNPEIIYNSENQKLSFKNATSYKNLLVISDNPNNKNTWTGDYELDEKTYRDKYFPFWNFTAVSRTYWSNNWLKFKFKLLKNRFVRTVSDDLKFLANSPFNYLLESTNEKKTADTNGLFLENGNETYLSKQAFDNENFPYWLFLKTAERN